MPDSHLGPSESDRPLRRTAIRVISIEVLVIAALWLLGRVFAA